MPRVPIPLIRKGGFLDAEKLFILSFEGEVTEKKYFEDFRQSEYFNNSGLIEIISLKKPNNSGSDPISVRNNLQRIKSEFNFTKKDEFWLIIDKDKWIENHKIDLEKLYEEISKIKNFYIALSNPCFELWLLLHIMDINEIDIAEKNKILLNKKVSNSKNYINTILDKKLLEIGFREFNKKPNPKCFLPRIKIAIERANSLNMRYHEILNNLGTNVHKLLEKLIIK